MRHWKKLFSSFRKRSKVNVLHDKIVYGDVEAVVRQPNGVSSNRKSRNWLFGHFNRNKAHIDRKRTILQCTRQKNHDLWVAARRPIDGGPISELSGECKKSSNKSPPERVQQSLNYARNKFHEVFRKKNIVQSLEVEDLGKEQNLNA